MKRVCNFILAALFVAAGNVLGAQVPAGTEQVSSQQPPQSQPLVISPQMGIIIPESKSMVYEFQVDTKNLRFLSPADQEKFFTSLKDDVVSYRYDQANQNYYLVLNKDYITKNNWKTSDINSYFTNRAAYMQSQYSMYEHPVLEK